MVLSYVCMTNGSMFALLALSDLIGTPNEPKQKSAMIAAVNPQESEQLSKTIYFSAEYANKYLDFEHACCFFFFSQKTKIVASRTLSRFDANKKSYGLIVIVDRLIAHRPYDLEY
jgi:hypothetical protein